MRPVTLQSPFGLRIPTYHFAGELYLLKCKISINSSAQRAQALSCAPSATLRPPPAPALRAVHRSDGIFFFSKFWIYAAIRPHLPAAL